jgi:hypothetical protein
MRNESCSDQPDIFRTALVTEKKLILHLFLHTVNFKKKIQIFFEIFLLMLEQNLF